MAVAFRIAHALRVGRALRFQAQPAVLQQWGAALPRFRPVEMSRKVPAEQTEQRRECEKSRAGPQGGR